MREPTKGSTNRRTFMRYAGASTAIALAGCAGDGGDGDGDGGDGGTPGDGGDGMDGGDGDGGGNGSTSNGGVDEVLVGSNHPLSGPLSSNGQIAHDAIQYAFDQKNQAGGIESLGGATLTLVAGDNEGAQELGSQTAQNLIDQDCVVQTGAFTSPATMAATTVTERNQIPFVVSVASDRDIIVDRGVEYTYRAMRHQYGQAIDYANMVPSLIRENGGDIETAGLLYVDNSFGQESAQGLNDQLPEVDVEVIEEISFSVAPSDLSTQVTRMRQADPDTVIITSYVTGGELMAQAMQDQDYRPDYLTSVATTTFSGDSAIQRVGDFANGITTNTAGINGKSERAPEVIQGFQNETDHPFNVIAALAYTAGETIIEAIEQAGSDEPDAIDQALQNLTFEDHILAMGPIDFQDNGENRNALAALLQVQDLSASVVYPEQFAANPFDYELLRGS